MYKPLRYIIILWSVLLLCCCNKKAVPEVVLFEDLVDLTQVDSIMIGNNKGAHKLDEGLRSTLVKELNQMTLEPNIALKMGNQSIVLMQKGQAHVLIGRTHGNYIEVPNKLVTKNRAWLSDTYELYFNTKGLNIDNY